MTEKPELYRAAQDRVATLVRGLDAASLAATVPSCPRWTVQDLVAHLSGTTQDFMTGNMADAPGDTWTQAHVDSRAGATADAVLEEWLGDGEKFAATLEQLPPGLSGIAVMDVVSHEHDIREAVGDEGAREGEAVAFTLKGFVNSLTRRVDEAGLPALRVVADDGFDRTAGTGEVGATVRGSGYELMRALSGRRSAEQVRALSWDGDPQPYLALLSPFGPLPT